MNPSNIPRAEVYDLRNIDQPPSYKYFLDTNILKFVFARSFIREKTYQIEYYPQFFRTLTKNKIFKFTFIYNLLELMAVLDRVEEELLQIKIIKSYRQNNLEQYLLSRQAIFEDVQKSLNLLTTTINIDTITDYFNIDYSIDLYDFVYHRLAQSGETAIVTDDYEFIFIPDVKVFTANQNAIQTASRFRRLNSLS